jgi:hypothetical protein
MIAATGGADFVQAETDVDQEHEDNRHPVVELGEDHDSGVYVVTHGAPLCCRVGLSELAALHAVLTAALVRHPTPRNLRDGQHFLLQGKKTIGVSKSQVAAKSHPQHD